MCDLQGELGCGWQDARVALQAHLPPSLSKAVAGNLPLPDYLGFWGVVYSFNYYGSDIIVWLVSNN